MCVHVVMPAVAGCGVDVPAYKGNWTMANRPAPGAGFERMTKLEFHEHIGADGQAFFAALAEAFGDADPKGRKRLYFEGAIRCWEY